MSSTTKSRIPRRPPRRHRTTIKPPLPPDPAITPTTMKGNYPKKDEELRKEWLRNGFNEAQRGGVDPFISGSIIGEWQDEWFELTGEYWQWHSNPDILDRIKALLLRFIDWWNGATGAVEDDKHIADGEHMATLAELFDEVDERQRPPRTEAPGYTICKR